MFIAAILIISQSRPSSQKKDEDDCKVDGRLNRLIFSIKICKIFMMLMIIVIMIKMAMMMIVAVMMMMMYNLNNLSIAIMVIIMTNFDLLRHVEFYFFTKREDSRLS